jgi:hypothetical protein
MSRDALAPLTWNALVAAARKSAMIATAEGAGAPSDRDVIASSCERPECFEAASIVTGQRSIATCGGASAQS